MLSKKVVTLNLKVNNYSNKVLGVVKEKFSLKNKSEALNKILDMYGIDFVEKEPKENVVKDIIQEVQYLKKNKSASKELNDKQIDDMCGV
jgi:hypothetical protein